MSTPSLTAAQLRNIAIIAHVDHGKTTLVDAMLHQAGAFAAHETVDERVLDSMDQERERGITILAKHAAVDWNGTRVNIIDTPGHADFGGEVERGLSMVDGALLLVDASEGPLPQTRFVLRKALERRLPIILVINKIDRQDARPDEVINEAYDLFIDLDADDDQVEFPIVYTNARAGTATLDLASGHGSDLRPLLETIITTIPAPAADPDALLQAQVTNLDASPYLGRLAICRVHAGELRKGMQVAWCRADGEQRNVRIGELFVAEGLGRVPADSASAGTIVAVAGLEDVMIGDTLTDRDTPQPLPPIEVDEPSISMTIGINTSPLAGRGGGNKLTARMIEGRLKSETVGNVSIRVNDIGRPDAWEVQGRGEMQLAVLVESMRREGYELTVGKPQVLTRTDPDSGVLLEPMEHAVVDVPDEYVGAVTQLLSARKGRMQHMVSHGSGWTRLEFRIPARGLIGVRTAFLSETRGTGQLHHVADGHDPWQGEIRTRSTGSLVADRPGTATAFALLKLEDRGSMFVRPGDDVYEGCIVGEHVRPEDLDVNIVREKHLTNHRSSTGDELVRLTPPRVLSLDEALEFVREDECVEVAPEVIRLRKTSLAAIDRHRERARLVSRNAQ
jgi:GTP-binding protein